MPKWLASLHNYFYNSLNYLYNSVGKKETVDILTTGLMKDRWIKAISNKFGRLTHDNKHGVSYTDTIQFISKQDVPPDKKVTYASFIFDYHSLKEERYRCCIIVAGDKYTTGQDTTSPVASLRKQKLWYIAPFLMHTTVHVSWHQTLNIFPCNTYGQKWIHEDTYQKYATRYHWHV